MPASDTPRQLLATVLLGRPLAEYVLELRDPAALHSWRLIAKKLAKDTDGQVTVTGEALRLWYGVADQPESVAS